MKMTLNEVVTLRNHSFHCVILLMHTISHCCVIVAWLGVNVAAFQPSMHLRSPQTASMGLTAFTGLSMTKKSFPPVD
jgi:hypothetical protein